MMTKKLALIPAVAVLLFACFGCDPPRLRKSDAELGLNPTQAAGRHIFDQKCYDCHAAYSKHVYKGPSLQGLFKKRYLSYGAPANDDRVRDVITYGHNKMPSYGRILTEQQLDDLIAYLHTL